MKPHPSKVFLAVLIILIFFYPCNSFSDALDDFSKEYRKLVSFKPFQENVDAFHNIGNQLNTISYENYTSEETAAFMKVFNLLDLAEMIFYYEQELLIGITYYRGGDPPLTYKRAKERWLIMKARLEAYVSNLEHLYGNLSNSATQHLVYKTFFLVKQSINKMDKFYERFYELLPIKAVYQKMPSGEIKKHELE